MYSQNKEFDINDWGDKVSEIIIKNKIDVFGASGEELFNEYFPASSTKNLEYFFEITKKNCSDNLPLIKSHFLKSAYQVYSLSSYCNQL